MTGRYFSRSEEQIIKAMFRGRRPMSVKEISESSGVSWITVKERLDELKDDGVVRKYKSKRRRTDEKHKIRVR